MAEQHDACECAFSGGGCGGREQGRGEGMWRWGGGGGGGEGQCLKRAGFLCVSMVKLSVLEVFIMLSLLSPFEKSWVFWRLLTVKLSVFEKCSSCCHCFLCFEKSSLFYFYIVLAVKLFVLKCSSCCHCFINPSGCKMFCKSQPW